MPSSTPRTRRYLGGGGSTGAIHRAGGPANPRRVHADPRRAGECPTGEAVLTAAGGCPRGM